jgi:hypothetical protein
MSDERGGHSPEAHLDTRKEEISRKVSSGRSTAARMTPRFCEVLRHKEAHLDRAAFSLKAVAKERHQPLTHN